MKTVIRPRNLFAALMAMEDGQDQNANLHYPAQKECPLLTILLPQLKKSLQLVLEFCELPEILAFQSLARQSNLPGLERACRVETSRLAERLIYAAVWNDLTQLETLLYTYHVPPTIVMAVVTKTDDDDDKHSHGYLTPLSGAAMRGNHAACQTLLEAGADVSWRDERGVTALEMATARLLYQTELPPLDSDSSLWKTMEILKQFGAQGDCCEIAMPETDRL